ncbi:MAG: glycoside hydrolase family 3 N-terminal domain-containing protein [Campylobacterota bacterium]|nr:glycoside hydrolase family 3 N-terminal domain-containing protein [Campylobacterota bacterium]
MKYFLSILVVVLTLDAKSLDNIEEEIVKKQIGRMLIVGFDNRMVNKHSKIVQYIQKYDLGGVILFDKHFKYRGKVKNITSPQQLTRLTQRLKSFAHKPLLISIDQEGGKVARLKPKDGFIKVPSAFNISKMDVIKAKKTYDKQSKMLYNCGINCNFAPVVDLAVNPKNRVISGLQRSFGNLSSTTKYAKIFIQSQKDNNIISVLKHFPGHGSSFGDSHKGFVDISKTWTTRELEPYKELMKDNNIDMIMTAHVFNSYLDKRYPATLSFKINSELLRGKLNYKGLIVSDDMQMKAITKHYSLKQSVTLAINAGVDILLFGNQLATQDVDELVEVIYEQIKKGAIKYERILESNRRIENLHTKHSIVYKPIKFGDERIALTKEYIKIHYGLDVEDIRIKPKSIVLHWTGLMKFSWCFNSMNQEKIISDRAYIKRAGLLNVSAHFLIQRDGTINQLMPDNWMARHVIGLNYNAIGIENIGGKGNRSEDLTEAQVIANVKLIQYLKQKYPDIEYLLGHFEYFDMEKTPLWLELNKRYRTYKDDPGPKFMKSVREKIKDLNLKSPYSSANTHDHP